MRLLWVLDNIPGIRDAVRRNDVLFGTLDTYLIYRLSAGKTHITDASSASATGMFDPFTMTWASWAENIFNVPFTILPKVCDSAAPSLAVATADVWGSEINICCSVSLRRENYFHF
jgi:putative glycerol kinase 5